MSLGNHDPSVCMKGPRRHVEVLCQLTSLCSKVPVSLGQSVCQLQCTADWSAVYNCTFSSYSAARLLALLRCRCASVARRLFAEGWRWPNPRGIALPPASVASAWTTPSFAFSGSSGTENLRVVHLGLPKDFMRFLMWLLLGSSYGHQWLHFLELFKTTCTC